MPELRLAQPANATDRATSSADATAGLWRRLARPFDLANMADTLLGLHPRVIDALGAVKLCLAPEAADLLAGLPGLSRSLDTSVYSQAVRSRGEVRGPILWSETLSARASSFGDEDLFVCSAARRAYDTPSNRVLVAALTALSSTTKAIDSGPEQWAGDERVATARSVARDAHRFLDHPSLSGVDRGRITARDIKRIRGGKSALRYAPAIALLEVSSERLSPDDLVVLCDQRTRLQHWVLLALVQALEIRGMHLPEFRAEGGALVAGPLTYIHPRHARSGGGVHGIMLGNVVIDVAMAVRNPDDPTTPVFDESELATRAAGRPVAYVRTFRDVSIALALAVTAARDGEGDCRSLVTSADSR